MKKMAVAAKTNSHRVHITNRGAQTWAVKMEGNIKPTHIYSTQRAAIDAAKVLVEKGKASRVIVHNKEGKIIQSGV